MEQDIDPFLYLSERESKRERIQRNHTTYIQLEYESREPMSAWPGNG